jgi:single-strand DNA-binding protein
MFTKLFRVGNEPQVRFTQNGDAVMSLSLAYNYGRKVDGKKPSQWIDASLWGKQAEALRPFITKGSQVVCSIDDLHIEEYEGKNGKGHKLVGKIVGFDFAGGKPEGAARPAPVQQGSSGFDDMDDDIQF